jgi:arylsulfatase A-like enzyme
MKSLFEARRAGVAILAAWVVCLGLLPGGTPLRAAGLKADGNKNVLFIAIDDLRPELAAYGKAHMKTPAIDRLAGEGVTFANAYSNVPVCGASRASLMTGLRPTDRRFVKVDASIDKEAPGVPTLPGYFKAAGYTTISLGKIIHDRSDSEASWSEEPWHPRNEAVRGYDSFRNFLLPENIALDLDPDDQPPAYEAADVSDDAYFDGKIALRAIKSLRSLEKGGKPFFLAVGFVKPHLPFNAPTRYWDLYPESSVSLTDNPLFPETAPQQARHGWGELRKYAGIPDREDPVPDDVALQLVRGYYAATSYVDAQVGRVLDELKRLGLERDTIVILWGDHGWSLGEHGLWAKHSAFNVANQIPVIVRAPGFANGRVAKGLIESVDIYPSLVQLAGLPLPAHLEGDSFRPMLLDPSATVNDAVFPRWKTGDSIRTGRYYYTEWRNRQGKVVARMLYDHEVDPQERVNVAESSDYAEIVSDLSLRLGQHIDSLAGHH